MVEGAHYVALANWARPPTSREPRRAAKSKLV